ncbi:MAG: hypothetical protein ACI4ED_02890 [Suilimivivens sp.]
MEYLNAEIADRKCEVFACLQKSKVIFKDNNLCCQFLNDYVDLPHFKDVRPEDIPDYLLDIIANVLRAFLRKENVPEAETETLVLKV